MINQAYKCCKCDNPLHVAVVLIPDPDHRLISLEPCQNCTDMSYDRGFNDAKEAYEGWEFR
jgi:hypothetical protein